MKRTERYGERDETGGENMEKQMQETVEEANEGVTADMLFSACIEEKLPACLDE